MNLLTIPLTLHVLTPVHIGCGQQLMKKEYVLDLDKNCVYVLDTKKFLPWLVKRGLDDAYFTFVTSEEKDLYEWLRGNDKKEEWRKLVLYTVERVYGDKDIRVIRRQKSNLSQMAGQAANNQSDKFLPINLMMKDPYGSPYIPGSSLKGAIRTALLNQIIQDDAEDASMQEVVDLCNQLRETLSNPTMDNKKIENLAKQMQSIEQACLHKLKLNLVADDSDALRSIMRGISISDSKPLNACTLTLCRKIDYDVGGKNPSYIHLLRECLKPGTDVRFTMTLDMDILKDTKIDRIYIEKAIKNFYILQNQEVVKKFRGFEFAAEDKRCVLYLGGGCGFHSKTLLLQLLGDKVTPGTARLLQFLYKRGGHNKGESVSPHRLKCTYCGERVLMGKCEVRFGG